MIEFLVGRSNLLLLRSKLAKNVCIHQDTFQITSIKRQMCYVAGLQSTDKTIQNVENVLSPNHADLSTITPPFPKSFNVAAYVNSSDTLKKLIDLNVNLNMIEKKQQVMEKLLKLDFETDIQHHIIFILNYLEDSNEIGKFITKNPMIFMESLEDLQVRINYLQSKRFLENDIKRIITKDPYWLSFSTERIDKRLGFHQQHFDLTGNEVRKLAVKQPRTITYNLHHIKTNSFVIKEEMGFTSDEIRTLVLTKPKLWLISQKSLLQRFNYIHNTMKISHKMLLKYPQVLLCRNFRIKHRHTFLENLGRAQYDPQKENYVPILALVEGTDVEFCKRYAKCTVNDFNIFLKTLC